MKLVSLSKIIVIPVLFIFCHCKNETQTPSPITLTEQKKFSFSQPHLGTTVHIVFYSDKEKQATKLSQKCFQRI